MPSTIRKNRTCCWKNLSFLKSLYGVNKRKVLNHFIRRLFFLFFSGFFFTWNWGWKGTVFISSLPLPSSHEYSDIYWELWDDYLVFLIASSSRTDVFCKKGVLRNFAKFTGKHLYQSLYFNKVAGQVCNFIKTGSSTGVFLWILRNF